MHPTIRILMAAETDRIRREEARVARRAARLHRASRVMARLSRRGGGAAAHRSPSRAAPGMDARTLGRHAAASLRGR